MDNALLALQSGMEEDQEEGEERGALDAQIDDMEVLEVEAREDGLEGGERPDQCKDLVLQLQEVDWEAVEKGVREILEEGQQLDETKRDDETLGNEMRMRAYDTEFAQEMTGDNCVNVEENGGEKELEVETLDESTRRGLDDVACPEDRAGVTSYVLEQVHLEQSPARRSAGSGLMSTVTYTRENFQINLDEDYVLLNPAAMRGGKLKAADNAEVTILESQEVGGQITEQWADASDQLPEEDEEESH